MPTIIGGGSPSDKTALQLATRCRNHIPNETRLELKPEVLKAGAAIWEKERPRARLRSLTAIYNCVGLVFGSRRTWIDTDEVLTILKEDGYVFCPSLDKVHIGDVVIYRSKGEIKHVGIVSSIESNIGNASFNVCVLSKWGAYGEYLHALDHVPTVFGSEYEFWSDRRQIL